MFGYVRQIAKDQFINIYANAVFTQTYEREQGLYRVFAEKRLTLKSTTECYGSVVMGNSG